MSDHLTNEQLKAWGRFYLRLIATWIWNGTLTFLRVFLGAAGAKAGGLVDFSLISWKGAGWILLGTILTLVIEALFKFKLPEPKPPE